MKKIKFNTPEQAELFRAIGSKDKLKSLQAQEALAAFIRGPVQQVLDQIGTTSMIYTPMPFDDDTPATIPLDAMYGFAVDSIQVWSQNQAGGLGTSELYGIQEMPVATFPLGSAVTINKKYARRARLDVISRYLNRMLEEIMVRKDLNGWIIIMKALGEALTNSTRHTLATTTQNVIQVDDFNRLITLHKRLNTSFANGTPDTRYSNGATDLFMSPEAMEQIRGFAYQPQNTRSGAVASTGATAVPLPDSVRERFYAASGVTELYGKVLHELNELGVGYKYNTLFGQFATGNIAHGATTFDATDDEIVVGFDLTREAFVSPISRNADDGATAELQVDDQWVSRSEKFGWTTSIETGFVCLDARAVSALLV